MSPYFYGIVESHEVKNFGPIGFRLEDQGKGTVLTLPGRQNLAAVIGPAPRLSLEGRSKERLVKELLAHQETLEIIMRSQFILPCKYATVLKDEQEAREILSQQGPLLSHWFGKMKDCYETDVVAAWDPQSVLREIAAGDPELLEMKRRFQLLSFADQQREKIASGRLLAKKLREHSASVAQDIVAELKEVSRSYATHEVMNDEMVLNASFLLVRSAEDRFFKALEGLDKRWEGRLRFKCVGPLPPYSFASVTLKRFDSNEIQRARETLGVSEAAHLDQVQCAYKKKARECHPDIHPESNKEAFEAVHRAYELLRDYWEGGCHRIKVSLFNVNREVL